jgi:class 3 adenylate cyclase
MSGGDAVNVASRMESHGLPGEIQITQSTYDLVQAHCHGIPRGTISVKGKGEMTVWQVVRPSVDLVPYTNFSTRSGRLAHDGRTSGLV